MCARPDVQVAEVVGSSKEGSAFCVICFGVSESSYGSGRHLFPLCDVRVIFENIRKYPYQEGGGVLLSTSQVPDSGKMKLFSTYNLTYRRNPNSDQYMDFCLSG